VCRNFPILNFIKIFSSVFELLIPKKNGQTEEYFEANGCMFASESAKYLLLNLNTTKYFSISKNRQLMLFRIMSSLFVVRIVLNIYIYAHFGYNDEF